MGRWFIIVGLVVVGIGIAIQLGVPFGKLPGDIIIRRGNGTFYFPIVTCLIVSIVLTIVGVLVRR